MVVPLCAGERCYGLLTLDRTECEAYPQAVVDLVEGLARLVFHTDEALAGLGQLPGAVRVMYAHAPRLWEEFRHKPHAERVRTVSRLTTGAVLLLGSSGAGAARVAGWGGKLGGVFVPFLSLSPEGLLAVRLVAVPVRGAAAGVGGAQATRWTARAARARSSAVRPPAPKCSRLERQ